MYNYGHIQGISTLNPDMLLSSLGSQPLQARVGIELEDWPTINGWMDGALEALGQLDLSSATDYLDQNLFFITHSQPELAGADDRQSHSNPHEAKYL